MGLIEIIVIVFWVILDVTRFYYDIRLKQWLIDEKNIISDKQRFSPYDVGRYSAFSEVLERL